jgi:electron transport complex protein RnfB
MTGSLADRIDALLPQTQCTKCGYPGCRPYAEAIATGAAAINRCPPGGDAGVRALAQLLGREYRPLDPACGVESPRRVAVIDEARCIGCTLCIRACPVDAILGAEQQMHTVLTELCSGCDLCVAPCPVDCIAMVPAQADDVWDGSRADAARARHRQRAARLARDAREKVTQKAAATRKRAVIQAAVERARKKKAAAAQRGR